MIRIHLTITGKVQGVNFRRHTRKKAKELGQVNGFAANEIDGSVTVVAEGPENKINELIDWCHSGPSTCEVEKVNVEKMAYTNEFLDFEIRH